MKSLKKTSLGRKILGKIRKDIKEKNWANIKEGSECFYYRLTKKVGLKLYSDPEFRDRARESQKEYRRVGLLRGFTLAPKVGKIVDLPNKVNYDYRFGYLTEHAPSDPLRTNPLELRENWRYDMWKYAKECVTLFNQTTACKLPLDDMHDENVGWIGDKPVLIDFG